MWRGRHRKTQFFLDFRSGKLLPPAGAVAHFTRPLHLRAPMHTRSLGHFLRDNLLPMIDLPMRFGRDPVDFDWVRTVAGLLTFPVTDCPPFEKGGPFGAQSPDACAAAA